MVSDILILRDAENAHVCIADDALWMRRRRQSFPPRLDRGITGREPSVQGFWFLRL